MDVTSQIVGLPNNTYTVTSRTTTYGFELNSNGYYESTNQGAASSAAVARVNFSLQTSAVVTIEYINYAQTGSDYGIFGRIDTALGTTNTADSNPYLSCSTSAYNMSAPQTLTYTVSSGSHYIDIKYRKNSSTNQYNDSLQFKIKSIEPTSTVSCSYTLTNVHEKHSLMFVFGNVNYYFITSSGTGGCYVFPDGEQVKLEGDSYKLVIIPQDNSDQVTITDNGYDMSLSLTYIETEVDGETIINYIYRLSNITADHVLLVSCTNPTSQLYLKVNGTWRPYNKVWKKINGTWVEQTTLSGIFDTTKNYTCKN